MKEYSVYVKVVDGDTILVGKYDNVEEYNEILSQIYDILSSDNTFVKLNDIVIAVDNVSYIMGHITPITL